MPLRLIRLSLIDFTKNVLHEKHCVENSPDRGSLGIVTNSVNNWLVL